MRKFLVKNFVLDYRGSWFGWKLKWFTIPKWEFNAPRASRIIYPLMVLSGFLSSTNPDWPNPYFLLWIIYGITLLSLYFGFLHFHIKGNEVKWEELDDFQKYQFGAFKSEDLTNEQYKEWLLLIDKFHIND